MASRNVSRWLAVVVLVLVGVTTTSAHGWTAEQQLAHEDRLSSMGAVVDGCAADPGAPGCPEVSMVVYPEAVAEDTPETGYGPPVLPAPTRATLSRHSAGVCGVSASAPQRYVNIYSDYSVRGRATNHCFSGQGVTYQEVHATLQRQYLGGGWQNLAAKSARRFGAGYVTTPYARYNCNHRSLRLYRTEGLGYSVVRGVGYTGINRKYEDHTCPS